MARKREKAQNPGGIKSVKGVTIIPDTLLATTGGEAFEQTARETAVKAYKLDSQSLAPVADVNRELLNAFLWYAERGLKYADVGKYLAKTDKTAKLTRRARHVFDVAKLTVVASQQARTDWTEYLAKTVMSVGSVDELSATVVELGEGMVKAGLLAKRKGRPAGKERTQAEWAESVINAAYRIIQQAETGLQNPEKPQDGPLTKGSKKRKVKIAAFNAKELIARRVQGDAEWMKHYRMKTEAKPETEARKPSESKVA